ncbi:helix-turn-helix domain-containing protein [Paenibacillus sp. 23TSA30-6]|uniref:helix-turn-helix domain-containing protein n=1 Tax=Paenibacillus sp. 23TSA30-6 TaxID=2546104 RepID=UPI0017881F0B|nr:helix-turn-helix transcriptional regulator [Paenibacillus sp. 23TSA30-6]MBE0335080.1 XRE family transcriptional regulator [Paenibacillus sp. 23TSA30-6]
MVSIPERIESVMKERGISRYKLSKETGIPYTTVTQILNGRTKNPQIAALQKIADYFNKPLDYFTKEETEENSDSQQYPEWATPRDIRDFKKILEEDEPVMFDGVPISPEDKEKIRRVMEAMFWDAKKENK